MSPLRLAGGAVAAGMAMSWMPIMRLAAVSVRRTRFTSVSCSFNTLNAKRQYIGARDVCV